VPNLQGHPPAGDDRYHPIGPAGAHVFPPRGDERDGADALGDRTGGPRGTDARESLLA